MILLYRLVLPVILLAYSSESCPDNWTEYNDHCYRLFTDTRTWSDAQDECIKHGSNLVKIETPEENSWLKNNQFIQGNPWIGAYTVTRVVWIWVSDNSTVTYNDWAAWEPNDSGGEEDCVHIHSGGWNDLPCTSTVSHICEKEDLNY
ncbi:lactose-binding lectin l-2-like isoform X2 [Argopecten irradians]|uniref:lactose-binding lectin l-2-like isoform X2 n=1 Tax=Argopecten irradians TaxID=31199 RepID=UPI003719AC00